MTNPFPEQILAASVKAYSDKIAQYITLSSKPWYDCPVQELLGRTVESSRFWDGVNYQNINIKGTIIGFASYDFSLEPTSLCVVNADTTNPHNFSTDLSSNYKKLYEIIKSDIASIYNSEQVKILQNSNIYIIHQSYMMIITENIGLEYVNS